MGTVMERQTSQRHEIRRAFERTHRPLGAQEVLDIAGKRLPKLGIATVYRAINQLVEEGWLVTVKLPGEPTCKYELANKGHHHHFHCNDCGKVYDVDGCPGGLSDMVPDGFSLQGHDLVLYGQCDTCEKTAPR